MTEKKKKIRLSNCWISLLVFGEIYKRDNGLFKIEFFENREEMENGRKYHSFLPMDEIQIISNSLNMEFDRFGNVPSLALS